MPLSASLVGTSFNASQIGLGAVTNFSPLTFLDEQSFAGDSLIGAGAVVTVTAVGTPNSAGAQTISLVISNASAAAAIGLTLTGTTVGVDASDFLVTGTVLGIPTTFYVTNSPAAQPPINTTVTVQPVSANIPYTPACYCAGTLIRTERGDVPVEALAIGDRVVTQSGALEPIRWIGTRSYNGRFLAGHRNLLPIRFRAGSLGEGVPARDLLVSPKHAMLIDGVLVAAELLVNGATIVQERTAAQVDYFHIELARHAVIWAEGAASETFVDDESRGMFHNAHTFGALYPDTAPAVAEYCAPRLTDGFELEAIRRRLAARADRLALAS